MAILERTLTGDFTTILTELDTVVKQSVSATLEGSSDFNFSTGRCAVGSHCHTLSKSQPRPSAKVSCCWVSSAVLLMPIQPSVRSSSSAVVLTGISASAKLFSSTATSFPRVRAAIRWA